MYLLCEHVDLGYHVITAFTDSKVAETTCEEMNAKYKAEKISSLIRDCRYTAEDAVNYYNYLTPLHFVEEVDVDRPLQGYRTFAT